MTSRYGRRSKADRAKQREARTGHHWAAMAAANTPPKFVAGQTVRIKRNSAVTKIAEEGPFGYKLEGYTGYFDATSIESA